MLHSYNFKRQIGEKGVKIDTPTAQLHFNFYFNMNCPMYLRMATGNGAFH